MGVQWAFLDLTELASLDFMGFLEDATSGTVPPPPKKNH